MSIFKKIAGLFQGSKPLVNAEVSTKDESRKNKKVKKNKGQVVDNSIDNSTQIAGDQINDSHDGLSTEKCFRLLPFLSFLNPEII